MSAGVLQISELAIVSPRFLQRESDFSVRACVGDGYSQSRYASDCVAIGEVPWVR